MSAPGEYDAAMAAAARETFERMVREIGEEADRLLRESEEQKAFRDRLLYGFSVTTRDGKYVPAATVHKGRAVGMTTTEGPLELGLTRAEAIELYYLFERRGMCLVDGSVLLMKFKADGGTVPQ